MRELVLGGARQKATEVSPDAEALMLNLEHDYDDGEFADVARRAQDAESVLAREPPCERREALVRDLELLWGAAVLATSGRAAAVAHFERALTLSPREQADQARFSPPVQELLERTRAQLSKRRKVSLKVQGPPGGTLFIDGLAQGELPKTVQMLPHRATLWVDMGRHSTLAHEVDVSGDTQLTIDVALETSLRDLASEIGLLLPDGEPARSDLIRRLAASSDSGRVFLEERTSEGQLVVTRFGSAGQPLAQRALSGSKPGSEPNWPSVVRDLLATPSEPAKPAVVTDQPAPSVTRPSVPVAALADTPVSTPRPFPWLATGLVAGAVVVAAVVVVAIVASSSSTNAILIGPRQATP